MGGNYVLTDKELQLILDANLGLELLEGGTTTGDIIRYNSVSGAWESAAEPLAFTQINLTPAAAAILDIEGGMYYQTAAKAVFVCTDVA